MQRRLLILVGLSMWFSGCVGLTNAPTVTTTCTVDEAWSIALASVSEFELQKVDKSSGSIETDWIAVSSKRKGGPFQRNVNQERLRFYLTVKPGPNGAEVTIHQSREFFSPFGVQSQSQGWRRIPAVKEEEERLAQRIQRKLQAKGC